MKKIQHENLLEIEFLIMKTLEIWVSSVSPSRKFRVVFVNLGERRGGTVWRSWKLGDFEPSLAATAEKRNSSDVAVATPAITRDLKVAAEIVKPTTGGAGAQQGNRNTGLTS